MSRSFRAAALLAAALFVFLPAAARADDATTVTIQGTTDVNDSHLIPDLLKPGFEAAYPQYKLNYVAPSGGTGAAFAAAEAGAGSGAVVHAPSIENQFVADGFSAEPYGRAIFYGDFVILGPSSDPAHVLTGAPHDAAAAFAAIANAGVAGTADFVSRGGASGTSVAEHGIWALAQTATTGVTFCTVSNPNGGGVAPSNVTGTCPGTANNPSWYHTTALGQGPNVTAADTCSYPSNACYTITDRGTFQYLQSTNAIAHLQIVTRDNAASAPGGATLLINSFHAYAVNPNANFTGGAHPSLNLPGAIAWLNYLTAPATQAAIGKYLNGGGDPPFLPSASPALTGSGLPPTIAAGTPVTVTGNIRNVVPGTPVLAGETVKLSTPAGTVATGTTDAAGNYSIAYTPTSSASYTVGTAQIAKIENSALTPLFGDLLAPATTSVGSTTVQSSIKVAKVTTSYRRATVSGTVLPGGDHGNAVVTISARRQGKSGTFVNRAKVAVTGGTFSLAVPLAPGKWVLQARYDDTGRVISSVASTVTANVPGASSAKISTISVSNGSARVIGSVSPKPTSSGGYVKLLGRHGSAKKYRQIGKKVKLAKGHASFTIKTHLTRGQRWKLEVEYVHKGHVDTSHSRVRTITVR